MKWLIRQNIVQINQETGSKPATASTPMSLFLCISLPVSVSLPSLLPMIDGKIWLLRWGSGWVGPCILVYHFTYMLIKINKHAHIEGEMDALFFSSRSVLHTLAVRATKFGIECWHVKSCPWCWKLLKLLFRHSKKKCTLQTLWRALKSLHYLNVDHGTHNFSIFWLDLMRKSWTPSSPSSSFSLFVAARLV